MVKEIESEEMKIYSQKKSETVQVMEERNGHSKKNEQTKRTKRKLLSPFMAEELPGGKEFNGQINTNNPANATKRRRVCATKNIAKIGRATAKMRQTNMKHKYRRTGVKTIGINRKCSSKEFENRKNTLIQRRKQKKNVKTATGIGL